MKSCFFFPAMYKKKKTLWCHFSSGHERNAPSFLCAHKKILKCFPPAMSVRSGFFLFVCFVLFCFQNSKLILRVSESLFFSLLTPSLPTHSTCWNNRKELSLWRMKIPHLFSIQKRSASWWPRTSCRPALCCGSSGSQNQTCTKPHL